MLVCGELCRSLVVIHIGINDRSSKDSAPRNGIIIHLHPWCTIAWITSTKSGISWSRISGTRVLSTQHSSTHPCVHTIYSWTLSPGPLPRETEATIPERPALNCLDHKRPYGREFIFLIQVLSVMSSLGSFISLFVLLLNVTQFPAVNAAPKAGKGSGKGSSGGSGNGSSKGSGKGPGKGSGKGSSSSQKSGSGTTACYNSWYVTQSPFRHSASPLFETRGKLIRCPMPRWKIIVIIVAVGNIFIHKSLTTS